MRDRLSSISKRQYLFWFRLFSLLAISAVVALVILMLFEVSLYDPPRAIYVLFPLLLAQVAMVVVLIAREVIEMWSEVARSLTRPADETVRSPQDVADLGDEATRPPRDVTDAVVQSVGGVALHLEYEYLPTNLLAMILGYLDKIHQKTNYRVVDSILAELDEFETIPESASKRLRSTLLRDQVLTIDMISTRHSIDILVTIGFGFTVIGLFTVAKYHQLCKQVAQQTREQMPVPAAQAVANARDEHSRLTKEEGPPVPVQLRGTVRRWKEEKFIREGRTISEVVLDPAESAIPISSSEQDEYQQGRYYE